MNATFDLKIVTISVKFACFSVFFDVQTDYLHCRFVASATQSVRHITTAFNHRMFGDFWTFPCVCLMARRDIPPYQPKPKQPHSETRILLSFKHCTFVRWWREFLCIRFIVNLLLSIAHTQTRIIVCIKS